MGPRDSAAPPSGLAVPSVTTGVSTTAYAALALVATLLARALAPALPGSATGIAGLISATSFAAACSSQLVAAGGIVLCLRLLGSVLSLPGVALAFRMLIVPLTLSAVALVIGAAARPLQPDLGRIAAVIAIAASCSALPFLMRVPQARLAGLVFLLAGVAGTFDLIGLELANQFARAQAALPGSAQASATIALWLDAAAGVVALLAAARVRKHWAVALAATLAVIFLLQWLALQGASGAATLSEVVLHRSLAALSEHPWVWAPPGLVPFLALLPLFGAGALLLLPGPASDARAALALCLLGRSVTGAPGTALLSVGAALLSIVAYLEERPEVLHSSRRHH
ncbi:MAG TPA: hypothetical protein VER33_18085 [Polyangiaceae bacterium]|nr:hypothetical protein [Polyangiaceae bacterium]